MQHKENVKRKISEAAKKSVHDEREKARQEGLLKKMDSGALESAIADLAVNPDLAPQYGIEFTPEVRRAIEDYRHRHPGLALGQASKGALAAARSGFTSDSSVGPTDPATLKPEPPAPAKSAAGPYKADAKIKMRKQVALPGAAPTTASTASATAKSVSLSAPANASVVATAAPLETTTSSTAAALPVSQQSSSDAASAAASAEATSKTPTKPAPVQEAPSVAPLPAAPLLPPLPRWQLVSPVVESTSESTPVDLQLPAARTNQKERERLEELHRMAGKDGVRVGKKRSLETTAGSESLGEQSVAFKKIAQSDARAFRKNTPVFK